MNALAKRTPEQVHEDLALEQLARAARLRRQLDRGAARRGTPEYGDLNRQRFLAVESARGHVAALHLVGYPISRELADAIAAEGAP
jgi:predicted alpha/beta-hydrolase family hydrolase